LFFHMFVDSDSMMATKIRNFRTTTVLIFNKTSFYFILFYKYFWFVIIFDFFESF